MDLLRQNVRWHPSLEQLNLEYHVVRDPATNDLHPNQRCLHCRLVQPRRHILWCLSRLHRCHLHRRQRLVRHLHHLQRHRVLEHRLGHQRPQLLRLKFNLRRSFRFNSRRRQHLARHFGSRQNLFNQPRWHSQWCKYKFRVWMGFVEQSATCG